LTLDVDAFNLIRRFIEIDIRFLQESHFKFNERDRLRSIETGTELQKLGCQLPWRGNWWERYQDGERGDSVREYLRKVQSPPARSCNGRA